MTDTQIFADKTISEAPIGPYYYLKTMLAGFVIMACVTFAGICVLDYATALNAVV